MHVILVILKCGLPGLNFGAFMLYIIVRAFFVKNYSETSKFVLTSLYFFFFSIEKYCFEFNGSLIRFEYISTILTFSVFFVHLFDPAYCCFRQEKKRTRKYCEIFALILI